MSDERLRRQTEPSGIITRVADANAIPKFDDGNVFDALMHVLVELLAFTSGFNRAQALSLFGPEVVRQVEKCQLHYARLHRTSDKQSRQPQRR